MTEGRHYQDAYVTNDLDRAVAEFIPRTKPRSVMQIEASSRVLTAGGSGELVSRLAFV